LEFPQLRISESFVNRPSQNPSKVNCRIGHFRAGKILDHHVGQLKAIEVMLYFHPIRAMPASFPGYHTTKHFHCANTEIKGEKLTLI